MGQEKMEFSKEENKVTVQVFNGYGFNIKKKRALQYYKFQGHHMLTFSVGLNAQFNIFLWGWDSITK